LLGACRLFLQHSFATSWAESALTINSSLIALTAGPPASIFFSSNNQCLARLKTGQDALLNACDPFFGTAAWAAAGSKFHFN
jgi:hypothetical protein